LDFQRPYDVDKDDFSELPESNNLTINPRVFYYPNASTTLMLGNSFTSGFNEGGDMNVIKGRADVNHTYFEKNKTIRNITTLEIDKQFASTSQLKFKQSLSIFDRHIDIPAYSFAGVNTNSFTDASWVVHTKKHIFINGINIVWERFRQENADTLNTRTFTAGAYFQDTWDITDKTSVESGIRFDEVRYKNKNYSRNQLFVLPRISLLVKWSDAISSRLGGGLGYKTPTIFTEKTESMQYQFIAPLNNVTAEKSIGGTADINYRGYLADGFSLSINQMFFYTSITKPLILQENPTGMFNFINADKPIISKGFETNLKLIFRESLKLFAGYTFTHAEATYLSSNQFIPLLPKNKLNLTLLYEKEDNFKIGLEGYFTDRQYLYNGTRTPSFWEFGLSAQKTFNKITFFINFENFTDQRQSNYKAVVNPPHDNPTFDDIWNHTEGFVVNGGIKLKL
jgi:iron complex outermembrane receptor protein/outer membrane receptor for ferrienterochelin and colicins